MNENKQISPSEILSFVSNYKDWYSSYILGERVENIYTVLGTAIHSFMESFFSVEPRLEDTIPSFATRRFSELFEEHIISNKLLQQHLALPSPYSNDGSPAYTMEEIKEWLSARIQQWVKETKPMEVKYGVVKAYEYNKPTTMEEHLEKGLVHGYLDALYTTDKFHRKSRAIKQMVVDYKTSSKKENTLATDYYVQMMIYAYMLHGTKRQPDWVCIDYLKYGEKYLFRVTEDAVTKIENLINDVHPKILEAYELKDINYKHGLSLGSYI